MANILEEDGLIGDQLLKPDGRLGDFRNFPSDDLAMRMLQYSHRRSCHKGQKLLPRCRIAAKDPEQG